jgi:hypothetical protein
METALVAGFVAIGTTPAVAIAGVLVFRFAAYALGLPGAVAYRTRRAGEHI